MNRADVKNAIAEFEREKCARVGHDWFTFNWMGVGTSRRCQRCGLLAGLRSVDADGTRQHYPAAGDSSTS